MSLTQPILNPEICIKSIVVPPEEVSDEYLVQKVKLGDVNAYGSITRRHNQRMYRIARSIVKNDADALDIVQEAHIKAFTKIDKYHGVSRFSTWLSAITRNEALMHLRKSMRERPMPKNEADVIDFMGKLDKPPSSPPSPESCLENKELQAMINDNVDQLPVDFRAVFVLREIEQLSTEETANILDIKLETVKTRLFRARRLMRAQIQTILDRAGMHVYEIGGAHCDAIVLNVLTRIRIILENKNL